MPIKGTHPKVCHAEEKLKSGPISRGVDSDGKTLLPYALHRSYTEHCGHDIYFII
jgi:hypothetical protein